MEHEAYFKEKDLYNFYIYEFLNKHLDNFFKNSDQADNRDFKAGIIWGISIFLLTTSANCEKYYDFNLNSILAKEDIKESKQKMKERMQKMIEDALKD